MPEEDPFPEEVDISREVVFFPPTTKGEPSRLVLLPRGGTNKADAAFVPNVGVLVWRNKTSRGGGGIRLFSRLEECAGTGTLSLNPPLPCSSPSPLSHCVLRAAAHFIGGSF